MRISTVRSRLMAGTIIGGAAIAAAAGAPAYAQTAQGSSAQTVKEVVITGSRIRQPNLTATSPVTTVGSQEVKLEGTQRTEDLVNNLPQVFASMGSTLSNGATGTATVNLRGLGCQRTLVLIDGRRLMPGDPTVGNVCADLNFIPSALIERVDVVTGGASAVYGSDALSGVVNFIMKKNFEGVRIDANDSTQQHDNGDTLVEGVIAKRAPNPQFPQAPKSWYGGQSTDITITVGANSADGKGNVTAWFGYRNTEPVTQNHFDYSACALDSTGGTNLTCGGSSTSNPPRFIVLDNIVNQNTISPSYTIDSANPGKLRGYASGDKFNFAPYNFFQRGDTRYTGGFNAHYQVNSKVEAYANFGFMDDQSIAQLAPSGLFFGNPYLINCDHNPLLSSDEVTKLCFAADPTTNMAALYIGRRNTEGGPRQSQAHHDQYRMVIGARGDLDDAWSYDVSGQYSQTNLASNFVNSMSKSHINRALDVVNAQQIGGIWTIEPLGTPGSGPTCRSVVNGSDLNCVPYNIFAPGGVTQGAVNYLTVPLFQQTVMTQQLVTGYVTGKLGKYGVKSPWAEDGVTVVLGGEYRRDSLDQRFDAETHSGDSTDAVAADTAGATNVKELFAELRVPLVAKHPFIDDLSLNGAYRRSTYNIAGTADTYSIEGNWTIVPDIRVRGSFNRAIRAPNVVELFAPPVFGLGGATDPCSGPAPKLNGVLLTPAQCAATGVTAAQFGNILPSPAGQYNTFGGGNKALRPEVGDTVSLGVVLRPRFTPNFSLTIDYFDIKELNVIQTAGADNIIADCINNPTLMIVAPGPGATPTGLRSICSLIHRNSNGTLWTGDNTTAHSGYTEVDNLNVGENRTRGIDFAADYRLPLERIGLHDLGRLDFNFVGTKLDKQYVQPLTTTSLGSYDCVGKYGPQCSINSFANPDWRHKMRVTWATPWKIDASIQWRYIAGIRLDQLGLQNALSTFPAYNYIDLSFDWKIRDNLDFHGGVNNLFDKDPPLWTTDPSTGTGNVPLPGGNGNTLPTVYDAMGRTIFMGLTANF